MDVERLRAETTEDKWLDGISDLMDTSSLIKFQKTVKERGALAIAVHGITKS